MLYFLTPLPQPPLPCSPSFSEVRYCISGWPFLTVSNAHQIPQVGGLRGLISANASTFTEGLERKVGPALHLTPGPRQAARRGLRVRNRNGRIHPDLIYTWVARFDQYFPCYLTTSGGGLVLGLGGGSLEILTACVTQTWKPRREMYSNTFFSVESKLRNVLRTHEHYFPATSASGYPQTTPSARWFHMRWEVFVTRGDVWILIPPSFSRSRLLCELRNKTNDVFQRWNEQPPHVGRWMIFLLQSAAVQTQNCCRTRNTRCLLGFSQAPDARILHHLREAPSDSQTRPRFTRWHCWQQQRHKQTSHNSSFTTLFANLIN